MSTNIRFTYLKIPILWETQETIPRSWSSKVGLLSIFTPRMSRLGLARIETQDKTKSPRGNMNAHKSNSWGFFFRYAFLKPNCEQFEQSWDILHLRKTIRTRANERCWDMIEQNGYYNIIFIGFLANFDYLGFSVLLYVFFKENMGRFITIYGTQWCASNHPVYLSERSGYLWPLGYLCVWDQRPIRCKVHRRWAGG